MSCNKKSQDCAFLRCKDLYEHQKHVSMTTKNLSLNRFFSTSNLRLVAWGETVMPSRKEEASKKIKYAEKNEFRGVQRPLWQCRHRDTGTP